MDKKKATARATSRTKKTDAPKLHAVPKVESVPATTQHAELLEAARTSVQEAERLVYELACDVHADPAAGGGTILEVMEIATVLRSVRHDLDEIADVTAKPRAAGRLAKDGAS